MFQLTPSRSKSLIRAVLTRYRYQLQPQIENTLKNTLINSINPKKDDNDENKCKLFIPSDIVVEQLNLLIDSLAKENNELERIRKFPFSARIYSLKRSSFEELCDELKLTKPPWPAGLKVSQE